MVTKKVKANHDAWAEGNPDFVRNRTFDGLVAFLFPDISGDLGKEPS